MSIKIPDIQGWMGPRALKWLARQARKRRNVIEVGVWRGRTTKVLAAACPGTVWAVDHWLGVQCDERQAALYAGSLSEARRDFFRNLKTEIRCGKVRVLEGKSTDVAADLAITFGAMYDMIFLDGDHSYEGCRADIVAFRSLLKPGGMLCGHDYPWPSVAVPWEGVGRAVRETFGVPHEAPSSIWYVAT